MKDPQEKLLSEIKDFIVAIAYTLKDIRISLRDISRNVAQMKETE